MGVSSSAKIRLASIGGVATLGLCLVWIGASKTSLPAHIHIEGTLQSSIDQIEMPLPPIVAAANLPLPKIVIAAPASPVSRFVHYEGSIHGSLFESAMAHGVPVAMLTEKIGRAHV